MRNALYITGLSAVVAVSMWACGSDVETQPTGAGGSSSTGGSGGAGGSTSSTTTTTSSTTGGAGGFATKCDEACYKVEEECGFSGACGLLQQTLGVMCGEPDGECVGECLLDEDCATIGSLATDNPDPDLMSCIQDCGVIDPCTTCVGQECQTEANDCQNDAACSAFLECAVDCQGDPSCVDTCASDNPSSATDALLTCIEGNCSTACLSGAGGSGGAGGAGGSGGSGGSGGT